MKNCNIHVLRCCLAAGLLLFATQMFGQGTRKVSFSKFALKENVQGTGLTYSGLELTFDVLMNWEETEFSKQSFNLSFRMVQGDREVMNSSGMTTVPSGFYMGLEQVGGKRGMALHGHRVFLPYLDIPLESGPQKADLIFSVSNDEGSYTDCFRTAITWQHKKIVRHNLNEQVFGFHDIAVDQYVSDLGSTSNLGMRIRAAADFKYGPEESLEDRYDMACVIRAAGKQVYDSRNSNSGDKTKVLYLELKEGKATTTTSYFVSYYDLQMDGPGDVEIAFVLLGAEGGPKEVFVQKMRLDVPPKYNYEDQAFTLQKVEVVPATANGVQGLAVHYACAFKYATVLRNPERGDYYFYLALLDENGKLVIDPARAPRHAAGSTQLMDRQLPSNTNAVAKGHLFIPYYMLNIPAGARNLKYALMVSDINLAAKFPVLGQGNVAIQKPEELKYWVALEELTMIDANYDVEFLTPGSHHPELQYSFCVGEDSFYESEYNRNSLTAIPGAAMLRMSKGDEMSMKLYDVDSGFFNASDLQGKWKIEYAGKASPFLIEVRNQGQVVNLRIKVDQR